MPKTESEAQKTEDFSKIIEKLKQSSETDRSNILEQALSMVNSLEQSIKLLECCLEHEKYKVKLDCNQIW